MFRLNAKGPPVWATLSESLCDFKSLERLVVHGILKRFRDCHFDNLVSVFLDLLTMAIQGKNRRFLLFFAF